MSRGKLRMVADVCGDCGASEPQWGSLSRGLLLCDECCSVHRSLGPHVSRVRHLHKASWAPAQLSMVHSLHTSGANAIWEHQLLEPGKAAGRRKPSARDSLHPVKSEFIRAKHQNLAFVHRVAKEGEQPTQEDLSKQLHASVRTANLETSLRLLAQGALPSHLHPDKGSTALHVAARSGQACQVELLLVYGADPTAKDSQGMTPADCARDAGHLDLEARLIESQYEVTDRLAHHLSGRNPEHHLGQHFILPEMADCLDLSAHARAAKQKLQSLPERLFVELARDLYDEVDRRECEAVWLGANLDRQAVPFLPVSPELSSTRNQARQKLARLTAREFATLLIDVLSEAKRRHVGTKQPVTEDQRLSDDEPLYDSVASDEDNNIVRRLLRHNAARGHSRCVNGATWLEPHQGQAFMNFEVDMEHPVLHVANMKTMEHLALCQRTRRCWLRQSTSHAASTSCWHVHRMETEMPFCLAHRTFCRQCWA
uniref:G protein-coupled receptor kinase interactor 2 n=1 Tax=Rhipicephalus appendiculatus TaxID=34631 RepID=A0A131Z022_RHIAP